MKIGIMLRHIEQRGGVQTYTESLLEHLLKLDRENHYVLIYRNPELLGRYSAHPNVSEVAIETNSNLLWDQIEIPRLVKSQGIELVFNPKLSVPLFAKCKKVFCMHGGEWFVFPKNYSLPFRIYHKVFGFLYARAADAIVGVTESASFDIASALGKNGRKVFTIHHGVETSFRSTRDSAYLSTIKQNFDLPDRYVLWVGQIYPMKNFSRLVRAFRKIRDAHEIKLVLTGRPHLNFEKELALIESLELTEDVQFLGWVSDEDLPGIYAQATVFAFPSLYEGFGIPLIEAMACGCPVVTSNRGAPAEVVGDAAVTVDPEDVEMLSNAISSVLEDESLQRILSKKGVARAAHFTWEDSATKTLQLFDKVMDS